MANYSLTGQFLSEGQFSLETSLSLKRPSSPTKLRILNKEFLWLEGTFTTCLREAGNDPQAIFCLKRGFGERAQRSTFKSGGVGVFHAKGG